MRSVGDRDRVRELLARGLVDREVSESSGVPVSTVTRWRRSWPPMQIGWRPAHDRSYAYLLGMYLGDGWLYVGRGAVRLQIAPDSQYPRVIEDRRTATTLCMPDRRPRLCRPRGAGATMVQGCSKLWVHAFPQHGRGPKHERPIVLQHWQRAIVDRHPDEFVRGLIHSDGCRTINRFRTTSPSGRVAEYAYARDFCSNLSGDIRGMFCDACDELGVWSLSNPRNVSVAHRASVSLLDSLGCRKD
jgi:hypothetical protein